MRFYAIVSAWQIICALAAKIKVPEAPEMSEESMRMKLKVPELSEEEANSNALPAKMKCDGCRAAAYKL